MSSQYLSKEFIKDTVPLPGLYWFFDNTEGFLDLVYLGQTVNLRGRLKQHLRNYQFDYFAYEYCPDGQLKVMEKKLLRDFYNRIGRLPRFNSQLG